MDPSSYRILLLQVADSCNFDCPGCHWFSSEITPSRPQPVEDYLFFLKRFTWIDRLVLSGGEPTLWSELPALVNNTSPNVGQVALYTNGSRPNVLKKIKKTNIYIRLSIHMQTSIEDVAAIHEQCANKGWKIKMFAYEGNLPEPLGDFERFGNIKINSNQLDLQTGPLSPQIYCEPRMIYIATDGNAYYCEQGLRTKEKGLRMGFSLTEGKIHFEAKECTPTQDCLTCALTEQYFHDKKEEELISAWSKM